MKKAILIVVALALLLTACAEISPDVTITPSLEPSADTNENDNTNAEQGDEEEREQTDTEIFTNGYCEGETFITDAVIRDGKLYIGRSEREFSEFRVSPSKQFIAWRDGSTLYMVDTVSSVATQLRPHYDDGGVTYFTWANQSDILFYSAAFGSYVVSYDPVEGKGDTILSSLSMEGMDGTFKSITISPDDKILPYIYFDWEDEKEERGQIILAE
jgi:hypothetical protein